MNDMTPTEVDNLPEKARSTTTALTADGGGIVFKTVSEARDVAYLMANSSLAVRKHLRGNPGACFGIVIQAVEWGMSPYAVANKSYVVNDQLAYESQLVQAVILRRAPIKGRIKYEFEGEGDGRVCIASAIALTGETVEYRSPPFGRITPKNSPLWKNDPDQQQSYYSGRGLCRRYFPDVLMGIYDVEELGTPMKDVTPEPSGFADRLQGGTGGFNPEGVETAIGEAQEASAQPEGTIPHPEAEAPPTGSAGAYDADAVRAGGQACVDGDPREVPDDFTDEQKAGWLKGYDDTAEAIGGRG